MCYTGKVMQYIIIHSKLQSIITSTAHVAIHKTPKCNSCLKLQKIIIVSKIKQLYWPPVMTWQTSILQVNMLTMVGAWTLIRVYNLDNTVGGQWKVFKQRFTKLIKVWYHRIVDRIVQIIYCFVVVQFLEFKVQFRHLLPQLSVPHLLEDMVGEDPNECHKCYDDRCVPKYKFVTFREFNIISGNS